MQQTEHKSFEASDETRPFPHGRAEILRFGGGEVGMLILEPGWRWGHDAWVVGDEPVRVVDWFGASNDARTA
jgi:hypothetical protein